MLTTACQFFLLIIEKVYVLYGAGLGIVTCKIIKSIERNLRETDRKKCEKFYFSQTEYTKNSKSVAKSYMRKGFLIYEEMHKYFHHI